MNQHCLMELNPESPERAPRRSESSRAGAIRRMLLLVAALAALALPAVGQSRQPNPPPFDEAAAREAAKRQGVPDDVMPEYLDFLRRRAAEPPKPPLLSPSAITAERPAPNTHQICSNGGFEAASLAPWIGDTGSVAGCQAATWVPGLVFSPSNLASQLMLMPDAAWSTTGFDPVLAQHGVALPIVPPNGGAHSLRLGNDYSGAETERIRQTFVVTPTTQKLLFRYALVLEDPQHRPECQPAFTARVLDSAGNVIHSMVKAASSTDPFFDTIPSAGLVYRRWSCAAFDLSQYLNQTVTAELGTADCGAGGHFGYAYVDGMCESNFNQPVFTSDPEYCADGPIVVNGSATEGELAHFWSVEESDASGGRPNPSSEVSEWFQGEAGSFDLNAWYAAKGKKLECGKHYRVKLAITTECTGWTETVRVIHIRCPQVDAGPDKVVCCGGKKLQIGSPAEPGVKYSWSPATGLDDAHSSSPTIDYGQDPDAAYPSLYEVTATDAHGCSAKDTVSVKTVCGCRPPAKVTAKRAGICSRTWTLTADCTCGDTTPSYEWSPGGATTSSIEVSPSDVPYSVTCRNECGATVSAPVTVGALQPLVGPFPSIQCPNIFTPNGDGANDFWVAKDLTHPDGYVPSYNATEYELQIFNRWGSVVAKLYGNTATGFANGSIPRWDGTATENALYNWLQRLLGRKDSHAGQPVSDGQYVYILKMRNCTTGWTEICHGWTTVIR